MSEIIPGKLFLGDMDVSEEREWLEQNNISHILVVGSELDQHYPHVSFFSLFFFVLLFFS